MPFNFKQHLHDPFRTAGRKKQNMNLKHTVYNGEKTGKKATQTLNENTCSETI